MSKKLIQAAAGAAAGESVYVEDVFSTYLYSGQTSSLEVNNGLDLDGEGGLVWIKARTDSASHSLFDTERTLSTRLISNSSNAEQLLSGNFTSFDSDGFTLAGNTGALNDPLHDYVSWSFRKQAGFFDVVTYTGDGTAGRTVSHNLGSVPGLMIIKNTDFAEEWTVYHRSTGATKSLRLDNTEAANTRTSRFNNTEPTATEFTVGTFESVNRSGDTIVAYLFAHDDQSFGDDSDESIIKCGSYTGDGGAGTTEVNLGFEPQWILVKATSAADNWFIIDNMRGWATESNTSNDAYLLPNASNAESTGGFLDITATGFKTTLFSNVNVSGRTYAYVAIRRPMKTPEAGTDVFTPNAYTGNGATRVLTSSNNPVDLGIVRGRGGSADWIWSDRLRGATKTLYSNYTSAEATQSTYITGFDVQDGIEVGTGTAVNGSSSTYISYMLSRATGFFDVVAYSPLLSDPVPRNVHNHNLGVKPELIIVKQRTSVYGATNWSVGLPDELGVTSSDTLSLNLDVAKGGSGTYNLFGGTQPTATQFTVGYNTTGVGVFGESYIAYLFATLAGVSKVGSYTGTGSDQNIDCGFSGSPRFLMIKRTDFAGDWYVWDSARGIVAGNDPRLQINSGSGGETTSQDWIDPYASGFTLVGGNQPNISGGSYIFLAIA